jgi:transcriptional regulator with XRE-family HTH domain
MTAESIGGFLVRIRTARGWSQLRMAAALCSVSGMPTVTRHEISRWERGERIPSGYWLGWLAATLDTPIELLERAAATARQNRARPTASRGSGSARPARDGFPFDLEALAARVTALRVMDDLVGGADLARTVLCVLRAAVATDPPAPARPVVAELAQLATCVFADAGSRTSALWAARVSLRLAVADHDRPLTAHVLGCLSETAADSGECGRAVRLATAAHRRAAGGPLACRAVQLHRLAYASARAGCHDAAETALRAAGRVASGRGDEPPPPWLRWLDEPRLTALTGRCYLALGRPRVATALLTEALGTGRLPARGRAIFGAWLGLARLESGDLDGACDIAGFALLAAIRSGSVLASRRVRALDAVLRRRPTATPVARYAAFADQASQYLPDGLPVPLPTPLGVRSAPRNRPEVPVGVDSAQTGHRPATATG